METLHDMMLITKGHEYLIAIGFLVLFTVFWSFISRPVSKPAVTTVFDPLGRSVPQDVLFHPGHVWIFPQPSGAVRVGIDQFLHRLTGHI